MKKLYPLFLSLAIMYSCNSDDDLTPSNDNNNIIENLIYDEANDGDLSNDGTAPTVITLTKGDNIIVSNQESGNPDYFTFTVPEGYELSALNVDDYDGNTNVNTNVLTEAGMLEEAVGFTGALSAGEYTVWLNQTGAISIATLNFVISEASETDAIVYDESTDGELSDDGTNPTVITLAIGENIISSSQTANADYFTFTIPLGYQLAEINLDNYVADDAAFIGIQNGASINGMQASDLLGGLIYGTSNIGSNILPEIGTLSGATGFTEALPAGEYTIWLNQTGATSNTTINLLVNMP